MNPLLIGGGIFSLLGGGVLWVLTMRKVGKPKIVRGRD